MDESAAMILVYTTFQGESDARKLGAALIEAKLAACVNIFPGMVSIYRWEGTVETGTEAAMLVKTRKNLQQQVLDAIAAQHPYSVPALIVFEPAHVAASYFEWLCQQTVAQD
jgi:periplasmic divalent cation tolerance protein